MEIVIEHGGRVIVDADVDAVSEIVGALRLEHMTTPIVWGGAMHGAAFLACLEQVPAPTLFPRRDDL